MDTTSQASPQRFRGARRKGVDLSTVDVVKTYSLQPGQLLPLVVEPAGGSVDLADWAAANRDFLETNLLKHGAILFRGFGLTTAAHFEAAAGAYRQNYHHRVSSIFPLFRKIGLGHIGPGSLFPVWVQHNRPGRLDLPRRPRLGAGRPSLRFSTGGRLLLRCIPRHAPGIVLREQRTAPSTTGTNLAHASVDAIPAGIAAAAEKGNDVRAAILSIRLGNVTKAEGYLQRLVGRNSFLHLL